MNTWISGILPNLSKSDREVVTAGMHFRVYEKLSEVFVAGQHPKGVFLLNSGKVKVFAIGDEGKHQIIHFAGPGELIGYRAMFSREKYRVTAQTLESSEIGFMNEADFLALVDTHKNLRDAVLQALAKELGERAVFVTRLAQRTVRQRLAAALLELNDLFAGEPINLSREDLANYIGTATESLIRLLKDFREEGLIDVQSRKVAVIDSSGLQQMIRSLG